ncbi:hypothetical protein GCM10027161_30040 [Microbispora hainanensis]
MLDEEALDEDEDEDELVEAAGSFLLESPDDFEDDVVVVDVVVDELDERLSVR